MSDANRQLLHRMHKAFSKGDIATVKDCLADDIIWDFPGHSKIAGVFQGKEDVLKHLGEPQRLGGQSELKPKAFFEDKEYGGNGSPSDAYHINW